MAEKFIDKVKFFMGLDDYAEDDVSVEDKKTHPSLSAQDSEEYGRNQTYNVTTKNKVVNIHSNSQMKVVIHQPNEFDETATIVDNLKNRKPVIINLENLDPDLARKIFDFCSGALYALDGQIQKVSKGIFILAPSNVDISGDVKADEYAPGTLYNWGKFER